MSNWLDFYDELCYNKKDLRFDKMIKVLKSDDLYIDRLSISSDSYGLISKNVVGDFEHLQMMYNILKMLGICDVTLNNIFRDNIIRGITE